MTPHAPRGADDLEYGLSGAQRHHGADRRSGHRQDDARPRGAAVAERAAEPCGLPEQPDADARRVRRVPGARFGLTADAATSKTRCSTSSTEVLAKRHQARHMSALIIDEAQCLPDELLEEIRLLANIETATEKLLPIVLAGQPELADRLNEASLRQLKQRVALRCELRAARPEETAAYIAARIGVAGGEIERRCSPRKRSTRSTSAPAASRARSASSATTRWSPAFALDRRPVDRDIVLEVCRDFDFIPEGASYDKTG